MLAYGIRLKNMDTIMAVLRSTCTLNKIAIMFKESTTNLDAEENLDFKLLIHNPNNINGFNEQQYEDDVNEVTQRAHLINNYFGRL